MFAPACFVIYNFSVHANVGNTKPDGVSIDVLFAGTGSGIVEDTTAALV